MHTDDRSPRRRAFMRVLLPALAVAAVLQSAVADAATRTNVAITVKPAAVTRSTTATFAWKRAGRITSTQCKLDRNRWRACRSSIAYRSVKPGAHVFSVRVRGSRTVTRTASWRVDVTAPTAPSVSGGSDAWFAGVQTIIATGSTDAGGAGMAGYQYRMSTDDGVTWSAPAVQNPVLVSAQGIHLVQFRAVDKAGNTSDWAPVSPDSSGTVKIDRTAPATPVLSGGSLLWQNVASVDINTGSLSDTGGSGLAADPLTMQTSTDGGTTWSSETAASSASVSDEGETLVRFRAHDAAGNVSPWVVAHVRIDRTAPSDPSLAGGSASWFDVPSMLVSASGSDDHGSGIAGYEYETSADGGSSWSVPAAGSSLSVIAEGETLVRFRAVDNAGLTSGWVQQTVRIDRTSPSDPAVSGTGPAWQALALVTASASGSVDTGGSGLDHYELRISTDGGSSWTAAAPGASVDVTDEGDTLVRFRAVDGAGNASGWTQGSVRLDRTVPTDPSVLGGSASWLSAASAPLTASGATDSPGSGIDHYEYESSTDGGTTWSSTTAGAATSVTDEGETLVRFRAVDGAGLTSGWVQATVRLDRTAPTAPSVSGAASGWQTVASVTAAASGSTDAGGSGLDHYEFQRSLDGGATWDAAVTGDTTDVTDEGKTSVRFRAVDAAGNLSPWTTGAVWLDRTPPTDPVLTGGSPAWLSQAGSTVSADGSTDAGSGLDHYELETSTDGGSTWSAPQSAASAPVSDEGETLVRFRAVDAAGLTSAWVGATVRLDRTAPTVPSVTGGSASWQNVASVTLTASGSTDAGGAGLDHIEYESSTDGGATWSGDTPGASAVLSAEGDTLVRFRAVDGAGNTSAWAQSQARIDRAAPSDPTLSGGSLTWLSQAASTVSAAGSADAGSGVAGYEFQTSTDGGSTWSSWTAGASKTVSTEGETIVRFRAVDGVGLTSGWVQATVRLDRTAPTAPTVSGGSSSWQNVASLALSAAGSTDARRIVARRLRVPDVDRRRHDLVGVAGRRVRLRVGGRADARPVPRRGRCRQRVRVGAGDGQARPLGAVRPDRRRRLHGVAERGVADGHRLRLDRCRRGRDRLRVPHLHRRRHDLVVDDRGRVEVGDGRGPDARAVPGDRRAGPALQLGAGDAADRPHDPVGADRGGRLHVVADGSVRLDHRERQHRHRRLGPHRLPVPDVHQRRQHLVGAGLGRLGRRHGGGHDDRAAAGDRRRRQRLGLGAGDRGRHQHRQA